MIPTLLKFTKLTFTNSTINISLVPFFTLDPFQMGSCCNRLDILNMFPTFTHATLSTILATSHETVFAMTAEHGVRMLSAQLWISQRRIVHPQTDPTAVTARFFDHRWAGLFFCFVGRCFVEIAWLKVSRWCLPFFALQIWHLFFAAFCWCNFATLFVDFIFVVGYSNCFAGLVTLAPVGALAAASWYCSRVFAWKRTYFLEFWPFLNNYEVWIKFWFKVWFKKSWI